MSSQREELRRADSIVLHTNDIACQDTPASAVAARSLSSGASGLILECPVCFGDYTPEDMETLGCGQHSCCFDCAVKHASAQVQLGDVPCCFAEDCHATIDPLVARRLLHGRDYECYLQMTLWTNPNVQACPRCCEVLFSEHNIGCDIGSCSCPSCGHVFCLACRCEAHGGSSCQWALQHNCVFHAALQLEANGKTESTVCNTVSGSCVDSSCLKVCPRCRACVEKADKDSCDHVTCARCRHEFCWACSADRTIILAHGNHYHWPHCKFFAPYSGDDMHQFLLASPACLQKPNVRCTLSDG